MRIFREALELCRESGDMLYFRPARQYVPKAWVETMAEHEWQCEETGACKCTKLIGCYDGDFAGGNWICKALLQDSGILRLSVDQIIANLREDQARA